MAELTTPPSHGHGGSLTSGE
ncbi:hypothetical protein A2U01_0111028, partial [Trifolium medium]|nr:hypothetical protein [Trifolium medium]